MRIVVINTILVILSLSLMCVCLPTPRHSSFAASNSDSTKTRTMAYANTRADSDSDSDSDSDAITSGPDDFWRERYISYLVTFGKNIERVNDALRLARFKSTSLAIQQHNDKFLGSVDKQSCFKLSINHFADNFDNERDAMFQSYSELGPQWAQAYALLDKHTSNGSSYQHRTLLLGSHNYPDSLHWGTSDNPIGKLNRIQYNGNVLTAVNKTQFCPGVPVLSPVRDQGR